MSNDTFFEQLQKVLNQPTYREFLKNYRIPEGPTRGAILGEILTEPQRKIAELLDQRRNVIVQKSVQDGITTLAVSWVVFLLQCGRVVLYSLPSLNLARDLWTLKILPAIAGRLTILGRGSISHSTPIVSFANGAKLIFRSGSGGDHLQSAVTADAIVIDEADDFERRKINLLLDRIVRSRTSQFFIFSSLKKTNGTISSLVESSRTKIRFELLPEIEELISKKEKINTPPPFGRWLEERSAVGYDTVSLAYSFFVHGDRKLYSLGGSLVSPVEFYNAQVEGRECDWYLFLQNYLGRIREIPSTREITARPPEPISEESVGEIVLAFDIQANGLYWVAIDWDSEVLYRRDYCTTTNWVVDSLKIFKDLSQKVKILATVLDTGYGDREEIRSVLLSRRWYGARGDCVYSGSWYYRDDFVSVQERDGVFILRPTSRKIKTKIGESAFNLRSSLSDSDPYFSALRAGLELVDSTGREIKTKTRVDYYDATIYSYLTWRFLRQNKTTSLANRIKLPLPVFEYK